MVNSGRRSRKLIIIGGGPAGYAAAIYAARAQLEPLVLAGEKHGGQLMLTTEVENYPGFRDGIMGPELMLTMREQAERFGAEIVDHDAVRVDFSVRPFKVWAGHHLHLQPTDHVHMTHEHPEGPLPETTHHQTPQEMTHEDCDYAESVLITTGALSIPLGVAGELELTGRGVSYCAVCDAAFFRNKRVFVVGGGDAAMEDTLALTKFASKITVIHRRDSFRASKIMQERVLAQEKVDVWWNTEVTEVLGENQKLSKVRVRNTQTGETREEAAEGLFVAIGHKPATEFLRGTGVELDEKGYVKTGLTYPNEEKFSLASWGPGGYPTMTTVEGVFAAGDNVDFKYRQAVTAAGYGVMAALDVERWVEK